MHAFSALVRKDLVLYFSNKRALAITLAAPILIAAFFGTVMGGAPKKPVRIPVAVVDLDASPISKRIVAAVRTDAALDVQEMPEADAIGQVRAGKVRAAAIIPAGFGEGAPRAMADPAAAKPQLAIRFDPSQPFALQVVRGVFIQHAMGQVGRAALARELAMPFEMRAEEVSSGERRYNGYAHAFAGMGVQFVLFMGIEVGVGLLLMRRLGLWKRLRAAPVSRTLLLGSRVASGALIAGILLAVIYLAAMAVFGVRIDGSVAGFVLIVVAFAILTSTFGLLIAALGKTPEATRGLAVLATLILVMLGGAWVPTFVFPEWMQTATLLVPTRWAVDGLEAMTWRGLGFDAAWPPAAAMLAFSAVFGAIAVRRFAWEE